MKNPKNSKNSLFAAGVLFFVFLVLVTALFILKEIKPIKSYIKKKEALLLHRPETGKLPFAKGKNGYGDIAFIIDDAGWNKNIIDAVKKLGYPVTIAIMPDTPYGDEIAQALSKLPNCQMILHLPLEPAHAKDMTGEKFIKVGMSEKEIRGMFDKDYEKFGKYIVGVNNHKGSLFTTNKEKMDILLGDIKSKNLFFVDSLTSPKSVGLKESEKIGLKSIKRDIFLDNTVTYDSIVFNIDKVKQIAMKNGEAVAIGHVHPETLKVLQEEIPKLKSEGFNIIFVSNLVK